MIKVLKPSPSIITYYSRVGGTITIDLIVSSIADVMAGYHISYSAKILLQDLELLTDKGRVNKKGREILSTVLHSRYHHKVEAVSILETKL